MPFLRIMALVLLLAPTWGAPADAQAPERRLALVIGTSEYKAGRLPTAANDAGLVAETLRTAGFDVSGARELDQDTLRRSIREFLDKVSAAGPQTVSLIYLAGYGLQFEGENYIVPVDATIARDEDIPIEAIRISDITRPLSGTPGEKLVIIDAARQHPFTPSGQQLASGLALVEPDPDMLIAFNTAPGSVAPIENGTYGAFAQALSEMIATGGLGLDDVFTRVRLRVNETTNGVAVPWYASKITRPFLFTEPAPDAPPQPQVASTLELQSQSIRQFPDDQQAYAAALERDTIEGYEEFVAAFPDSAQARRVRALLAVRREALMWRRVLSINSRESYWSYVERYPQGAHVADAERRLALLAADYDPPPAFVPMAFADIPPPPPDEVVYLTQPEIVFDDPAFVPPPLLPAFFCPPRPRVFVALPPPPPPVGAFFLPAPVVPSFSGRVHPPAFVVAPPRPPVQEITVNHTTVINQRAGSSAAAISPALPGAVVARVNSGALHAPPPAPPAPPLHSLHNASLSHPGGSVLGTKAAMPPRMHAATATPQGARPRMPGAAMPTPAVAPSAMPGGARVPARPTAAETHAPVPNAATTPGGPRPPMPNTAATTPAGPRPAVPGAEHRGVPDAAATPGRPHVPARSGGQHPPGMATTTPGAPRQPAAPAARRQGGLATPAPHVTAPSPPPHALAPAVHAAPPPPPVRAAPPPPRPVMHAAPPPAVRAAPPPPRPVVHAAPPPARPAPAPGKKCAMENGRQVCR